MVHVQLLLLAVVLEVLVVALVVLPVKAFSSATATATLRTTATTRSSAMCWPLLVPTAISSSRRSSSNINQPISNTDHPTPQPQQENENPLWPNGVSDDDITELIDAILADPSINIPQLPDFLERQIYKTTTVLTYNAVYRLVGWVHHKELFGHQFKLTRVRRDKDKYDQARQTSLLHMKTDVDEDLLEDVADQLLANAAINQPLLPDVVERQLYINCLKIIFRILNMLAASFRITVCGHDMTLNLNKSMDRNTKETVLRVARNASFSETPIDTQLLQELARSHIFEENDKLELDLDLVADGGDSDSSDDDSNSNSNNWESTKSFWKQGIHKSQKEVVVQVNTVLYSLILGILDDLLANTELVLMTDRIHLDIIPPAAAVVVEGSDTNGGSFDAQKRQSSKKDVAATSPKVSEEQPHSKGILRQLTTNEMKGLQQPMQQIQQQKWRRLRKLRTVLTFILGATVGIATQRYIIVL